MSDVVASVMELASEYRVEILLVLATLVVLRALLGGRKAPSPVARETPKTTAAPSTTATTASSSGFLHPTEWREVTLTYKEEVNHNTKLFRFSLPSSADVLNLPVGKHIKFGCVAGDEWGHAATRAWRSGLTLVLL